MGNLGCEFCNMVYPDYDQSVGYYYVNVFGNEHIICGDCKKHLKKIKTTPYTRKVKK